MGETDVIDAEQAPARPGNPITIGNLVVYCICAVISWPFAVAFMATIGKPAADGVAEAIDNEFMKVFLGGVAIVIAIIVFAALLLGPTAYAIYKAYRWDEQSCRANKG
ncbi:hypothetical protein F4X86_04530 [Candidatus Saccharibacteria bacterium]|nr:hypothetical protein [Candidatus Saccharibacteria bacterium]